MNPRATTDELGRLEAMLGVPLPEDVVAFYSTWNGMSDYESAGDSLVSFWSIDRICREADVARGGYPGDDFIAVAFADVLIYSWCFRFCVRSGRIAVTADGDSREFSSLTAFFEVYLSSPKDLSL